MAKAEGIRANKGKRDEARERWELDWVGPYKSCGPWRGLSRG